MHVRRWPFIGRDTDLAHLLPVLDAVERGEQSGIVLVGAAGVGKTRLLAEFTDVARQRGVRVRSIHANRSAAAVPLGAMTDVVLSAGNERPLTPSPDGLFHDVVRRLIAEASAPEPWMLVIDDLALLDDASAAAVHQCIVATGASLVASGRDGDRWPAAFEALWRQGTIERQHLDQLSDAAVAAMLDHGLIAVFGGAFDSWSRRRLVGLANGNPLAVRQLIEAIRETGAYRRLGDGWELTAEFTRAGSLQTFVADRIAATDDAGRRALELVAAAEPIDAARLATLVGDAVIDDLISRGLLAVADGGVGASPLVRCAHPLIAEVLGDQLPPGRRRQVARELLAAHSDDRAIGPGLLRRAIWHLDAGDHADVALLATAAATAWHAGDHALAITCANAAVDNAELQGPNRHAGAVASLVRASARVAHGLATPSAAFPDALSWATTTDERLAVLSEWAWASMAREGPAVALDVLARARGDLIERIDLLGIDAVVATVVGYSGQWRAGHDRAIEVIERMKPSDPVKLRLTAMSVVAMAAGMAGPVASVLELGADILPLVAETPTLLPNQVVCGQAGFLYGVSAERGVDAMVAETRRFIDDRVPGSGHLDFLGVWYGVLANQAISMSVFTDEARRWCDESLRHLRFLDPCGLLSFAVGCRGMFAVMCGDTAGADEHLGEYDDHFRRVERKTTVHADRGRAWQAFLRGDLDEAFEWAGRGWAAAWERADVALWATPAAHDMARFGRPELAIPLLEQAAGALAARFPTALLAHARAVASGDAAALVKVADEFRALGARGLRVEALAMAADLSGQADAAILRREASAALRGTLMRSPVVNRLLAEPESRVARNGATPRVRLNLDQTNGRWVARFDGRSTVVRDLAGISQIASLLAAPDQPVSATTLAAADRPPAGSYQPILDDTARRQLQHRALQLVDDLRRARTLGHAAQVDRLEAEAEAIAAELHRTAGHHGASRRFADETERARTAVRKSIVRGIAEIAAGDPEAGAYLAARITTGTVCSFSTTTLSGH